MKSRGKRRVGGGMAEIKCVCVVGQGYVYVMLHDIYIYSFSRCFYPKQLPRESFTKVHKIGRAHV